MKTISIKKNKMNGKENNLLWTDALYTSQPESSEQKGQHPPALNGEVGQSASHRRYGRSVQLLRLLEITPLNSGQPEIRQLTTLCGQNIL